MTHITTYLLRLYRLFPDRRLLQNIYIVSRHNSHIYMRPMTISKSLLTSIIVVILCISGCLVTADRLPNQTPENQIFAIDTVIDVTGVVDDGNSLLWVVASPGAIPAAIADRCEP